MTKQQLIKQFKLDYPTLTKQSNDEVITLDQDEYEQTIDAWADVELAKIAKAAEDEAKAEAKSAAQAKLAALGLTVEDLQALGL
jgi:hypothetical protein